MEQMQHLKKLGVDTCKASMCWLKDLSRDLDRGREIDMTTGWNLNFNFPNIHKFDWLVGIPTFTLQDILNLLPKEIEVKGEPIPYHLEVIFDGSGLWEVSYTRNFNVLEYFYHKALLEAAYEMLYWVAAGEYIKTTKEDKNEVDI